MLLLIYTRNLQALSKLFLSRVCTSGVLCVRGAGTFKIRSYPNRLLIQQLRSKVRQDHSKSFTGVRSLSLTEDLSKNSDRERKERETCGQCCCDCQPSWPIFWRAGLRCQFGTVLFLRLQPSKIVIFNLGVGV